ncbi:MAG: hypothetical protein V4671_21510, partial [Armatimonadota bacterium]
LMNGSSVCALAIDVIDVYSLCRGQQFAVEVVSHGLIRRASAEADSIRRSPVRDFVPEPLLNSPESVFAVERRPSNGSIETSEPQVGGTVPYRHNQPGVFRQDLPCAGSKPTTEFDAFLQGSIFLRSLWIWCEVSTLFLVLHVCVVHDFQVFTFRLTGSVISCVSRRRYLNQLSSCLDNRAFSKIEHRFSELYFLFFLVIVQAKK